MGTASSTLVIGLRDNASKGLRMLGRNLNGFQRGATKMGGMNLGLGAMTKSVLALGAGYLTLRGALGGTIGSAIKFESAMADVKKVVDTTPAGFQKLSDGILGMSKRIPVASSGLASIMASAGQSGIAAKDLLAFTELTSKSAVAMGMSADEAGDRFAKLKNVFGLTQGQLLDLANGANHLSNKFAATGAEILEFTNRAAGAAKGLGHSVAELQALGASMVASGIVPETAARGVNAMATNLSVGGKKVSAAFRMMGLGFKDWRKLRDKNGPEAMTKMFEAIQKLDKDKAAEVWANLVGKDFSDDFSKLNLKTVADAYAAMADQTLRAGSVTKEFETRAATAEFALQRLKNNIGAIGVELGTRFLPAIADGAGRISDDLASMASSNDDITDRIRAAWSGLKMGLGEGDLFAGIKSQFTALEDFVFGTYRKLGDDAPPFEKIAASIANERSLVGITEKFKALGQQVGDIGSKLSKFASGDFSGLTGLGSALLDLARGLGPLGTGAVAAGTVALLSIGKGILGLSWALATSPLFRIVMAAEAITRLAEAFQKVEGLGDLSGIANAIGGMSLGDWAVVGLGGYGAYRLLPEGMKQGVMKAPGIAGSFMKAMQTSKWGKVLGWTAAGGGALAALLNGRDANAAEVGPEARGDGTVTPREGPMGQPQESQPRAKPRAESTKPGSDPNDGRMDIREGLVWAFRNILSSGGVASIIYDDLANPERPEQYLGAGTGDPEFAAELKRFREMMFGTQIGAEPARPTPPIRPSVPSVGAADGNVVADPARVAEENEAIEHLISVAQRAGELRASASPAGTFRGNLLSPDQQAELASINAEIRTATDGMPEVRDRVQAIIRDIQSGATDAAGAADQIRQALADAGVRGGQDLQQGVQSGVSGLASILDGAAARAFASGAKISGQLAAGIRSKAAEARAAAAEVAQGVADHFPQSPAKVGPLRELVRSGSLIPAQLADGMSRMAPVVGQSAALAGIVSGALAGLGSFDPAMAYAGPQPAQERQDRVERMATVATRYTTLQDARSAAPEQTAAQGDMNVSFEININGATGDPRQIADTTVDALERRLASVYRKRFGDVL
ncbi:phage tail tape measure protein [Acuticoccus sediminis]|uniref:phage tail tape measure protein n=1 Tax=Acuticoccus sediminis TaxID=2184697 RepID=UPI00299D7373|nr:phage tail tape measure protein [Acuticoccus sediminis]